MVRDSHSHFKATPESLLIENIVRCLQKNQKQSPVGQVLPDKLVPCNCLEVWVDGETNTHYEGL